MAIIISENNDKQVTYDNAPEVERVLFRNLTGNISYEEILEAVSEWLEDHPEATTTVEDGSLLPPKFDSENEPSDGYVLSWNATAGKFEWTNLTGEVSQLKQDLQKETDIISMLDDVSIPFTIAEEGYSVNHADGQTTSNTNYAHTDYIQISEYSSLSYKRTGTTVASTSIGMAFYDEDKQYINGIQSALSQSAVGYVSSLFNTEIPDNAVYARFSTYKSTTTYGSFEVYGKSKILADHENLNKIAKFYTNIVDGKTFANRFTAPNGQGATSDSWRQFQITVTPGEKYSFSGSRIMTCYYAGSSVVSGGLDNDHARVETVPATSTSLMISFEYAHIDTVAVVKSETVITIDEIENIYPADTFSVYNKGQIDQLLADTPEIIYLTATPSNYRTVMESITDSSYNKRYVVYLTQGTYDIWNMFTEEEKADSNFKGLWTPPFTSLVGVQKNVVLNCDATSSRAKLATVNLDVTASISYCKVTATNCRYAIHDDWNTRKWFDNSSLPDYWSNAFQRGFVRVCDSVETEITNSAVGASWGCGTVNATVWINRNCKIGSGGTFSYTCHNDGASIRGARVTLENCRCESAIRFSSLNQNYKAECYAHLIGTSATGVRLTEENATTFGAGIRWHIDGFGNTFDNSDVTITNTDGEDYSSNVDLIGG